MWLIFKTLVFIFYIGPPVPDQEPPIIVAPPCGLYRCGPPPRETSGGVGEKP